MDALMLSRIQFGCTASFHYIFPPLSIGLGAFLVFVEAAYLITKDPVYEESSRFWTKIFGLIFAIGVATGIVMEFEFGTNWSNYSRFVGDIFGSALAAEGIFAFFLESGFLALLLFGWNRISRPLHFFSTLMVALGAHFSAIWIVVANSWQQTPSGFVLVGQGDTARAQITDFWQVVFSPSSIDRIFHVYTGAWQAGAFMVLSVSAYYLLKNKHTELARASMKIALSMAVCASLLQLYSGHLSGLVVSQTQPAKLAAFEGHYPASAPASMYLFGWVDEKNEATHGVAIPNMLSVMVHNDPKAPVTGLDAFDKDKRPPVNSVFQSYHAMIAIGMLLILISLVGVVLWWSGKLYSNALYLKVLVFSVLLPQLGNQLGWFSAEVGRQPYIVYNLMTTAQGLSRTVTADKVWISLVMFSLIYLMLFILFIYLLNDKIQHGPDMLRPKQAPLQGGHRA